MEQLLKGLKTIRQDVDFENEKELVENGILTSVEILMIVAMIEDTFEVKIPASKLRPANFNSAESMWNLIQTLQDEE